MVTRFIVLSLLMSCLAWSGTVWAQGYNATRKPRDLPPNYDPNDLSTVPDSFFKEADGYRAECQANWTLRRHHNCECLANEYLDLIIKNPEKSANLVMLAINGKCHDATEAAGREYELCMGSPYMFPRGIDPEEYCECVANTYALAFERSNAAFSSNVSEGLQTSGYSLCRDPQKAKRYSQALKKKPAPK